MIGTQPADGLEAEIRQGLADLAALDVERRRIAYEIAILTPWDEPGLAEARIALGAPLPPAPTPDEADDFLAWATSQDQGQLLTDLRHWRALLHDYRTKVRSLGHAVQRRSVRNGTGAIDAAVPALPPPPSIPVETTGLDQDILDGRDVASAFPTKLVIDPINSCNLRCRTCSQGISQDFPHSQLSARHLQFLAEAMLAAKTICLFGTGEPMLVKGLLPFVSWLGQSGKGRRIDFLTNGTLLDRKGLSAPGGLRLGVSVDGANPETFEALRHGARFDEVMENIRAFRRQRPEIELYLNATISRCNMDEIAALAALAADLGATAICFSPVHAYEPRLAPLALTAEDAPLLNAQLQEAQDIAARNGLVMHNSLPPEFPPGDGRPPQSKGELQAYLRALPEASPVQGASIEAASEALRHAPPPPPLAAFNAFTTRPVDLAEPPPAPAAGGIRMPHCFAPWKFAFVESDGRVRPCCVLDQYMGDINDQPFANVWNGQAYRRLRRAMLGRGPLPARCRHCTDGQRYEGADATLRHAAGGHQLHRLEFPDGFKPPASLGASLAYSFTLLDELAQLPPANKDRRIGLERLLALAGLLPDSASLCADKGRILAELERHDEAAVWYDRSVADSTGSAQAWEFHIHRGHYHWRQKRPQPAFTDFRQAAKLRPEVPSVRVWGRRAAILLTLRDAMVRIGLGEAAFDGLMTGMASIWRHLRNRRRPLD